MREDPPSFPGPLATEWSLIESILGYSPPSAHLRDLQLTFERATGRIENLTMTFLVPSNDGVTLYAVTKGGHEGYEVQSWDAPRVDPCGTVPLEELLAELDRAELENLAYPAGKASILEIRITCEEGRVLGREPYHRAYVLSETVEAIDAPRLVAASGRVVVVHTYPLNDRSGELLEDKNRMYLLASLIGSVERVDPPAPVLKDDEEWMDVRVVDIDGDGAREFIYLVGRRTDPSLFAPDERWIVIAKGNSLKRIRVPDSGSYYGTLLQMRDMTGDGTPDLLFQDYIGGSGGVVRLNVFRLNGDAPVPLWLSEDHEVPGLHNEYLGESVVRVSIPSWELVWEFGLRFTYSPDDDSFAREAFSPDWADPFSGYEFSDLNDDGTVEITGCQRICGISHADAIAELRRVFSWDGATFRLRDTLLYHPGLMGRPIAPASSPYGSESQ